MKIYLSHLRDFDFENELYKPIRESVLNSKHEFFFPHESGEKINTKEIIKNSDLVVVEVSSPSFSQGIELGWADIFGVPIVCISKEGSKISSSLKYISDSFITYTNKKDFIIKLSDFLTLK